MSEIDEEKFYKDFKPIKNPLDENVSFDGCMFEDYGEEYAFVLKAKPECVWTILEADDHMSIVSGLKRVNKTGFLITENPWVEDTHIELEGVDE